MTLFPEGRWTCHPIGQCTGKKVVSQGFIIIYSVAFNIPFMHDILIQDSETKKKKQNKTQTAQADSFLMETVSVLWRFEHESSQGLQNDSANNVTAALLHYNFPTNFSHDEIFFLGSKIFFLHVDYNTAGYRNTSARTAAKDSTQPR